MGLIESQIDRMLRDSTKGKYGLNDVPAIMDRLFENEKLIQETHGRLEEMEDVLNNLVKAVNNSNRINAALLKEMRGKKND